LGEKGIASIYSPIQRKYRALSATHTPQISGKVQIKGVIRIPPPPDTGSAVTRVKNTQQYLWPHVTEMAADVGALPVLVELSGQTCCYSGSLYSQMPQLDQMER
jgi:cytochrome oxidase assembly protein ShyY1